MKRKRKKRGGYKGKKQKMGSDACLGNDSKEYSMTKKTKQNTTNQNQNQNQRVVVHCCIAFERIAAGGPK